MKEKLNGAKVEVKPALTDEERHDIMMRTKLRLANRAERLRGKLETRLRDNDGVIKEKM